MKAPRFTCCCRLSELMGRARQAADAEAACLAGLATLLLLAAYYR